MNSIEAWARDLFSAGVSFVGGIKLYLIVFAVGAAVGAFGTYKIMHDANEAAVVKSATKTVKVVELQHKITFQVGMQFEPVRLKIAQDTADRQQEVPAHVTPQIDVTYPVPCGFVRVFNAATHGPLPDPASCPDGAASSVALSAVGRVETQNDGQYDLVASQLTALQDWIRQQQTLSEKN